MTDYSVIDLFCGIGGLTKGFVSEGFQVVAGIDSDPSCKYAYEANNKGAAFIRDDITNVSKDTLLNLYPQEKKKILIGCAPCQPFSNYTNKLKKKNEKQWSLLGEFGRLISELEPDIVSMENVPSLSGKDVFSEFVSTLNSKNYHVSWQNVYCPDYGIPQSRLRLVLLASKLGDITLIPPTHTPNNYVTTKETIGHLPPVLAGEVSESDPLHHASRISDLNLKRIKHSKPGGTWKDWPKNLRATCHTKDSGKSYHNVYGRMEWDKISPTITTEFTGFGNGRFGHPEQDRALTLREGALLQTFPKGYKFFEKGSKYYLTGIAKHIGNAVPVLLGKIIAKSIKYHLQKYNVNKK